MKKFILMGISFCMLMCGCSSNTMKQNQIKAVTKQVDLTKLKEGPQIAIHPKAMKMPHHIASNEDEIQALYDENMGWNFRNADLSKASLRMNELELATFDDQTIWPKTMPEGFDVDKVVNMGKDPGLGIRKLHEQGITGKNINIAIIDQSLLLEHKEYKGKIKLYENLHLYETNASMHGAGLASIAVGNDCGVAPDANLYYIASDFFDYDAETQKSTLNLSYMAKSIERVIEINHALPEDNKIRVIAIARGFNKDENEDVYNAIEKAKKEGMLVITTSTIHNYDVNMLGVEREANADPNDPNSMHMVHWEDNPQAYTLLDFLYIPIGHRTVASPGGINDYAHYSLGGLSWAVPWLAGMYALCLEVDPTLTGEEFLELALQTGDSVVKDGKKPYCLNNIINPQNLIYFLQGDKKVH